MSGLALSQTALEILRERYLARNSRGEIVETPEMMISRVCRAVASAEEKFGNDPSKVASDFERMLSSMMFLPNSPTLSNAGLGRGCLSACFTIPVGDSLDSILEALKIAALIQHYGGGVGFDFSELRPAGDIISGTGGTSSGPCSFITIFDALSNVIKQGGRRRGANMGIMRCDHPDVLEFIRLKSTPGVLSNFNISVAITDDFMNALESGSSIQLINPRTNQPTRSIPASQVWDSIVENAWATGEPGVVFIDRINKAHPLPRRKITATNPCVTGDTLIAVADGRVAVPIRELAREGNPVPVYCKHPDGSTHISWGRSISLTRSGAPVYMVVLSDGSHFRATPDHLVMLSDGSYSPVADLSRGERLMGFDIIGGSTQPRVEKVRFAGYEDVYDMHVDRFHNFCIITRKGKLRASGVALHNCGEQPLLPWESCNLGSVNLAKFVDGKGIDWDSLGKVVKLAVRFLDDVIEVNVYPDQRIEKATLASRKIGLGVMGWADMLAELRIPYDSDQALQLADQVMGFITQKAVESSAELAEERGVFPLWEESVWAERRIRLRNATLTTIAPTGTISMIAGASPGIEPYFAICYHKRILGERLLPIPNPVFERAAMEHGFYSEDLMRRIAESGGSVQSIRDVPEDIKPIFKTAYEISPEWHVRMQAAFQRHVHNAVSKTVNLPEAATKQDVDYIFRLAYRLGCKGVTVYRRGSRQDVVVAGARAAPRALRPSPRPRPESLPSITYRIPIACGTMFITVSYDESGDPFEVFANIGHSGGCIQAQCEAIGRLCSLSLRCGVEPSQLIDQLSGIRCSRPSFNASGRIYSCADAISHALRRFMEERGRAGGLDLKIAKAGYYPECPRCGGAIAFTEGCRRCLECGFSDCG